ncbi:MAG: hypothetical protein ACP5IT_11850 [Thermoproteota archaeon]
MRFIHQVEEKNEDAEELYRTKAKILKEKYDIDVSYLPKWAGGDIEYFLGKRGFCFGKGSFDIKDFLKANKFRFYPEQKMWCRVYKSEEEAKGAFNALKSYLKFKYGYRFIPFVALSWGQVPDVVR